MSKLIVVVCFLAAFAAGVAVGTKWFAPAEASTTTVTTTRPSRHGGWLARELALTPDQQEQMKKIWSEVPSGWREGGDRRRQLFRERDEAIAALVGPENKARYEEVQKRLAEQMTALEHERQEFWQRAVDQTKGILSAQQREKYETILKSQPGGPSQGGQRGGRDRRGWTREHGRPGSDRATSQPGSAPENQS